MRRGRPYPAFGRRGSVSSVPAVFAIRTLATRSFFGRHSFMEDGLRDGISLGLELNDANQKSAGFP